jgi:hypothetical protein
MSSNTIDRRLNNKPNYIWTLNDQGYDAFGSWSATNQRLNSLAQVWINSSNIVILKQTASSNTLQAIGSNGHPVSEQTWLADLTWSPSAPTPSSITYKDPGGPSYHLRSTPVAVPSGQRAFGKNVLTLLQSMSLVPGAGFGGRDWTQTTQWWQKPAVVHATAWWAWNINIIP